MTKASWIERLRFRAPREVEPAEPDDAAPAPVERSSPGLGALFALLREDGRHSILDLAPASDRHLRFLGRYSRHIRFAGLVPEPPTGEGLASALAALAPNPSQPYDVVLAWDVFDRLDRSERSSLVALLAEFTAPGARLYAVVDASGAPTVQPVRSTIVDIDRVAQHPVGSPRPARPQLLPAHMEGLFSPFEITHAFMLRIGLREYVTMKPK